MDSLLDEPAIVLVALSAAAILFIVEVALPTAGVAGTMALLLAVAALVAIDRQDAVWWPLLGPKLAAGLWTVMIARRSRSAAPERAAVVLFAVGSAGFGLANDSPVTAALGIVAAGALGWAFPLLHGAAMRLLLRPAQVGMESLIGAHGEVVAWKGSAGTIVLEGSRWAAKADDHLRVGDDVEVLEFSGMTLRVARPIHRQP